MKQASTATATRLELTEDGWYDTENRDDVTVAEAIGRYPLERDEILDRTAIAIADLEATDHADAHRDAMRLRDELVDVIGCNCNQCAARGTHL